MSIRIKQLAKIPTIYRGSNSYSKKWLIILVAQKERGWGGKEIHRIV